MTYPPAPLPWSFLWKDGEGKGAEWKEGKFGADVLIAGWLAGNLDAYVLSDDGRYYDALRYDFEAIGTGGRYAYIAKSAVKLCEAGLDKLNTLKIVMDAVAGHVDDCFPSIDIWRINKDVIEIILNSALLRNPRLQGLHP